MYQAVIEKKRSALERAQTGFALPTQRKGVNQGRSYFSGLHQYIILKRTSLLSNTPNRIVSRVIHDTDV